MRITLPNNPTPFDIAKALANREEIDRIPFTPVTIPKMEYPKATIFSRAYGFAATVYNYIAP